ncbi:MAG: hypothetical protein KatS3mg108_2526 [Isosphaeraceae bacterium]|nr:MAG: hypothetical protein KatS3mg108_2526 [Isosphaeraceae bacterium]
MSVIGASERTRGERRRQSFAAALGLVILMTLGGNPGQAAAVDHAAVCRCAPCRDESRCCCVRRASRAGAEEMEPPMEAASLAEVRIVRGGCAGPGPGATSPRVLSEMALAGWMVRSEGLTTARVSGPRDP